MLQPVLGSLEKHASVRLCCGAGIMKFSHVLRGFLSIAKDGSFRKASTWIWAGRMLCKSPAYSAAGRSICARTLILWYKTCFCGGLGIGTYASSRHPMLCLPDFNALVLVDTQC